MSRMRRLISIALALALLFSNVSVVALANIQEVQEVEQIIDAIAEGIEQPGSIVDEVVVEEQSEPISAEYASNATGKVITLPKSLKTIEIEAFYKDKAVKKVVLSNKVKRIEARAFANSGLIEINLPKSITYIDDTAFDGLSNVSIMADEGSYAYDWAVEHGYISVSLPVSPLEDFEFTISGGTATITKYIGNRREVCIPDTIKKAVVTAIEANAFANYNNLTRVVIPDSVEALKHDAFKGCSNLSSVNYPKNWKQCGDWSDYWDEYQDQYSPFTDCANLKSIVIPEGVTAIPDGAFNGLKNLKTVDFPSTLKTIGSSAFAGCSQITSINIPAATTIGGDAFSGCSGLKTVSLPNGLQNIEANAFSGCVGLTSIAIPDSVEALKHDAFKGCSNLSSVNYPKSWKQCGDWSDYWDEYQDQYTPFTDCANLKSIVIPKGVISIPEGAFNGCKGLKTVSLPNGLKSIEAYAFSACTGLTSISIGGKVDYIGEGAFDGHNNNLIIYGENYSYAQAYAYENKIDFLSDGDDNEPIIEILAEGSYNGHSYQLIDTPMPWWSAKILCEKMGGHLATITSQGEQSFIESMLSKGKKNTYWLGGFADSDLNWHWVTSETFNFTNWQEGQPDHDEGTEDKLEIYRVYPEDVDILGKWNDMVYNGDRTDAFDGYYSLVNKGFICEWDTIHDDDVKFSISHKLQGSVLSQGNVNGSFAMSPAASKTATSTLNISSNYIWTVSASDSSWMIAQKIDHSKCLLTVGNVKDGKKYTSVLTFTVGGTNKYTVNVVLDKTTPGSAVSFMISHDLQGSVLAQGSTSGSFAMFPKAGKNDYSTLHVYSDIDWTVTASDESWVEVEKTDENTVVMTLKDVKDGKRYTTDLSFNAGSSSYSVQVVLDKANTIDITTVNMNQTGVSLAVGDTFPLIAVQFPLGANIVSESWSSGNTAVATVDQEGNVKAVSEGTSKITATLQSDQGTAKKGTCIVTVLPKSAIPKINSVSVSPATGGKAGDTFKMTVKTSPNIDSIAVCYYADYYYRIEEKERITQTDSRVVSLEKTSSVWTWTINYPFQYTEVGNNANMRTVLLMAYHSNGNASGVVESDEFECAPVVPNPVIYSAKVTPVTGGTAGDDFTLEVETSTYTRSIIICYQNGTTVVEKEAIPLDDARVAALERGTNRWKWSINYPFEATGDSDIRTVLLKCESYTGKKSTAKQSDSFECANKNNTPNVSMNPLTTVIRKSSEVSVFAVSMSFAYCNRIELELFKAGSNTPMVFYDKWNEGGTTKREYAYGDFALDSPEAMEEGAHEWPRVAIELRGEKAEGKYILRATAFNSKNQASAPCDVECEIVDKSNIPVKLMMPIISYNEISNNFGRYHDVPPAHAAAGAKYVLHSGNDMNILKENVGTAILAAIGGEVTYAGWAGSAGYEVKILDRNGIEYTYMHMLEDSKTSGVIKYNEAGKAYVEAGDLIGFVSNSGNPKYGYHVHFQAYKGGAYLNVNNRNLGVKPEPDFSGAAYRLGAGNYNSNRYW